MRIAIITGAAQGLGLDMACRFAKEGYKVVALDIKECTAPTTDYIETDLANPTSIIRSFSLIKQRYGKAHVLVNNGAISAFVKHICAVSLEDYDSVLDTNLRGAFVCAREFIALNKGEDYGRIINIASTRWHQNMANWELYGMSKGGIVSLTNSLCVSLRGTSITVNAISPGHIHTGDDQDLSPTDHHLHPSNRVGTPRDISNVALFLANEENDFVNGANILVDGGMTKRMIYLDGEEE